MRPIFIALIAVACLNIALVVAGWFGYSAMASRKAEASTLREQVMAEKLRASQSSRLQDTLKEVAASRAQLNEYLYENSDEDGLRFVKEIEVLAKTTGVNVTISGADFVGTPPNLTFHMALHIDGTLTNINQFMRLLETFPARLVVPSFSLQLGANDTGSIELTINLLSVRETRPAATVNE